MARIAAVETIVTSLGGYCNYVLVKVVTDDGGYGWGDASLAGREAAVAATLEHHFAPMVVGRDPLDTEDIWQVLFRGGYWRGGPVLMSALAGIDMALWDIKGKVAGLPVYQLLGGRCRTGALAYTHAAGRHVHEVEAHVRALVDLGFKVVRCQGPSYGWSEAGTAASSSSGTAWEPRTGATPEELFEPAAYLRSVVAMFEHLRGALGDSVELCHDAHERLHPVEAARLAKELEPFRLFFLEDVLRPDLPRSFRLVRTASSTPLAMGELFHSLGDCLELLSGQLVDFIRCDLAHSGGISEGRRIAAVADAFSVRTAWHGPADISPITHAANVHLDLAIPNFGVQEYTDHPPLVREVVRGGPFLRDGYLDVDDTPGLGVEVDEVAARAHPYRPAFLPVARRTDGSLQDW